MKICWEAPGSSIMMYTPSHQRCLSHPCLWIFKSTYSIIHNSPFSSQILREKRPLIYEMLMLLCQLVRVQVLQEAALQDVTRCRAYLLSHCNVSLAEVNELDTGCPWPAQQTELPRTPPSFFPSTCHQPAALHFHGWKQQFHLAHAAREKLSSSRVVTCAFSRLLSKVIRSAMSCICLSFAASQGLIVPALSHSCLFCLV